MALPFGPGLRAERTWVNLCRAKRRRGLTADKGEAVLNICRAAFRSRRMARRHPAQARFIVLPEHRVREVIPAWGFVAAQGKWGEPVMEQQKQTPQFAARRSPDTRQRSTGTPAQRLRRGATAFASAWRAASKSPQW